MEKEILEFIKLFKTEDTLKLFTSGLCYWFAHILHARFSSSELMYDEPSGHFVTRIDGELYDISGKVTNQYKNPTNWNGMDDDLLKNRIVQQVILKKQGDALWDNKDQ